MRDLFKEFFRGR